ncbi:MAG: radical SAM/SPASM domain-containing protein [Candidatus Aenigmatarchaeota archaeon]
MVEKIEQYKTKLERLRKWKEGKPQGPISIHLDMTNRCNLKCKFCWQRSHERKGWINYENELSEEKLLDLVDEAKELGVKHWLLSGGGEPLLRTETAIKVMEKIKKLGMHGDIITNGTIPDRGDLKRLVLCGWDRIRFSINSYKATRHDFLVGKDRAFEKAVKNIIHLNRLKKKYNKNKPEIGFNTVINSENWNELHEIMRLLSELNGNLMNVQTIILYSEEEEKWTLTKKQKKMLPKYVKRANKIAIKNDIDTNVDQYLDRNLVDKSNEMDRMDEVIERERKKISGSNDFSTAYCYEPWYLMTIRADGTVGSCRLFGDDGVDIHNKSLEEVWFGDYFKGNREKLKRGEPLDFCSKCGSNEFLENKGIREKI